MFKSIILHETWTLISCRLSIKPKLTTEACSTCRNSSYLSSICAFYGQFSFGSSFCLTVVLQYRLQLINRKLHIVCDKLLIFSILSFSKESFLFFFFFFFRFLQTLSSFLLCLYLLNFRFFRKRTFFLFFIINLTLTFYIITFFAFTSF